MRTAADGADLGGTMRADVEAAEGAVDLADLELPVVATTGEAYLADPHGTWREVRGRHWLARTELGVNVLRHRECVELLKDRRLTSIGDLPLQLQGVTDGPLHEYWTHGLLNAMPDGQHHRLRRLQTRAFSANAIERMRPIMRQIAEELVAELPADGRCDIVGAFVHDYPVRVIAAVMGIPRAEVARFSTWSSDLCLVFSFPVAPVRPRVETAIAGMYEYMSDLVERRRADPGEDLISRLISAEADGETLTRDEVCWQALNSTIAGHDTTRNQLAFLLRLFATHPDLWEELAVDPALAAGAVAEGLRLNPILPAVMRSVAEDFEYRGVRFPAGDAVFLRADSANRDPDVFTDPDRFDIRRANAADALSFGGGAHHCLGVHLARAEMQEALPVLAAAMPGLRLDGPGQWRPNSALLLGPESMPVSFDGVGAR